MSGKKKNQTIQGIAAIMMIVVGVYAIGKMVYGLIRGDTRSWLSPYQEKKLEETGEKESQLVERIKSHPEKKSEPTEVKQVHKKLSADEKDRWSKFKDKYGTESNARFSSDGYLASVRGRPGQGSSPQTFNPSDPKEAIDRANEILDAADDLIGLKKDSPLDDVKTKSTPVSAQVFYRQTYRNLPVQPYGSITIDLGKRGELVGLHSDYVRNLSVVNNRKIDLAKAKLIAQNSVEKSSGLKTVSGGPLIWVGWPHGGVSEARYAYEFMVQGNQVIVDADSGKVLMKRNRRIK